MWSRLHWWGTESGQVGRGGNVRKVGRESHGGTINIGYLSNLLIHTVSVLIWTGKPIWTTHVRKCAIFLILLYGACLVSA